MSLDADYDRVMVRAVHFLNNPIRIRVKKLSGIRPFYARNAPEFNSEIERWKVENGTLINYRPFMKSAERLPHDATLLCECPLSIGEIEDQTRDAIEVGAVYRPPSWRQHEELAFIKHPPGTTCKRLIQAVENSKPTREYATMAKALNIPTSGTHAMSDDDLMETLGVTKAQFTIVRKRAMRSMQGKQFSLVTPVIPRIEPTDRALLAMYRYIKDELPAAGHIHFARDNVLSKVMRFWKIGLRALVRSGSVERKPYIGFYFMDGLQPDYARIQAEHEAGKSNLQRMIELVDALPEFPFPRSSRQ